VEIIHVEFSRTLKYTETVRVFLHQIKMSSSAKVNSYLRSRLDWRRTCWDWPSSTGSKRTGFTGEPLFQTSLSGSGLLMSYLNHIPSLSKKKIEQNYTNIQKVIFSIDKKMLPTNIAAGIEKTSTKE